MGPVASAPPTPNSFRASSPLGFQIFSRRNFWPKAGKCWGMPPLDLTAEQREALRGLRWLYAAGDEHRRTGRTTALAVMALWLAVEREGAGVSVPYDHAITGPRGNQFVSEYAVGLGRSLDVELEQHPRLGLRVMRASVTARVWLQEAVGRLREAEPVGLVERVTAWERLLGEDEL